MPSPACYALACPKAPALSRASEGQRRPRSAQQPERERVPDVTDVREHHAGPVDDQVRLGGEQELERLPEEAGQHELPERIPQHPGREADRIEDRVRYEGE